MSRAGSGKLSVKDVPLMLIIILNNIEMAPVVVSNLSPVDFAKFRTTNS